MNWRTPTVLRLCEAMREQQDYSALPILADALQDADYPDAEVLEKLRSGKLSPVESERQVALIYSDETNEAVRWMENFVRKINYGTYEEREDGKFDYDSEPIHDNDSDPHTYEAIMQMAMSVAGGFKGWEWGMHFATDAGADYFRESDANKREFWKNFKIITGQEPEDYESISYACAC